MRAHVLLKLLNEFRKSKTFIKFNNTGAARMLDSLYHMALKLLKNCIFRLENIKILPSITQ